jgi:hypothetical protein
VLIGEVGAEQRLPQRGGPSGLHPRTA